MDNYPGYNFSAQGTEMCTSVHGDSGIYSVTKGSFSALVASFILASEAFRFEEHVPLMRLLFLFLRKLEASLP